MTQEERDTLKAEHLELQIKMTGDFVSPKDMRRFDEITSLLMTDGASKDVRFVGKRGKDSNRVTSFTKDRR